MKNYSGGFEKEDELDCEQEKRCRKSCRERMASESNVQWIQA